MIDPETCHVRSLMPVRLRAVDVAVTQLFAGGVAHVADSDVEVERDAGQGMIAINGDGVSLDLDDGDDLHPEVALDAEAHPGFQLFGALEQVA